ncbi:MAG: hypothetical protein LBT01_09620 [Spirochaetaceae bacterium]|nr:hypothetical protein [Spirochaetaceae bacterium]
MKKRIVLAAALFLTMALSAMAASPIIRVINATGYAMYHLQISPASSKSWEEDVLGRDVLLDNEYVDVRLPKSGRWDVRLIDEDGDTYTLYNIRIYEDTDLTVGIDALD